MAGWLAAGVGVTCLLYAGFLVGCYYAAQILGPVRGTDGNPTTRWQRAAYFVDRWIERRLSKGRRND